MKTAPPLPNPLPCGVHVQVRQERHPEHGERFRVLANGTVIYDVTLSPDGRKLRVTPPGGPWVELDVPQPPGGRYPEETVARWVLRYWSELLVLTRV
ncbi:hypothetical protein [Micromonospora sp. WMMC273]|uniref:hypothetical protein n=1 Tax=Micromonospora sp. WMMC273 TaxID=3015157 RepID=UPI0022B6B4E5|nr:hypothetical protein [Micromonospora sp. WMMC273]MCZ7478846.1 hypothetical protein [Micromonospora sp. WMMC273]